MGRRLNFGARRTQGDYIRNEEANMATYVITEDANVTWDDEFKYKYRYESRDGLPTAQEEFERRRAARQPAVLWRWEHGEPTLMERYNA
jgi:hypothetical protein